MINNVGELIRVLSHWCPDTPVEVLHLVDGNPLDIMDVQYDEADTLNLIVE